MIDNNDHAPPGDANVIIVRHGRSYDIDGYNPQDHILHEIRRRGEFYEQDLLDFIASKKLAGMYLDIGANIGNHSVFFAAVCKADRVIAVEPHPGLEKVLGRNLTRNVAYGKYSIFRAAVYPNRDHVFLKVAGDENIGKTKTVLENGDIEVPAVSIDCIVEQLPKIPVTLIKMDIEGAELPAIQSGLETIKKFKPLLAIESLSIEKREEIRAVLEPLGYRIVAQFCYSPVYVWEWEEK